MANPGVARRRLLLVLAAVATALPVAREIAAQQLVSVASGEVDYYCALSLALEQAGNTSPDFESNANAEQFRIAKELATRALPLAQAIRDSAPSEVAADADVMVEGVRQVARDGDFRVLGLRGGESVEAEVDLSPQAVRVRAALARLHSFNVRHCAWRPQPVNGGEMAYLDVPATLPPGLSSFEFANLGGEIHQMLLVRRNHGSRERLPDLLDRYDASGDPDGRLADSEEITFMGQAFAPPGKSDHLVADLEPGAYAMVCFIPTGSVFVSEMDERTGAGPTHYRLGMAAFFTVTR